MSNKYLKTPWHSVKNELPNFGGAVCVCACPYLGSGEYRMIFHKAREGKDYFVCFGRAYDYDMITYWRYNTDKEE